MLIMILLMMLLLKKKNVKNLKSIIWDHNATGLAGFRSFVSGLEANRTLKMMPLPISDLSAMLSANGSNPDAQKVYARIQAAVADKQMPQRRGAGASVGLGSSSTAINTNDGRQELMDKQLAVMRSLAEASPSAKELMDTPENGLLLEDCQRIANAASDFQLARVEVQHMLEDELPKTLSSFSQQIAQMMFQLRSQLAEKMSGLIEKNFKTIDHETAHRLVATINYGTNTIDHTLIDKILIAAAGSELESGAIDSFNSAVDVGIDYVCEKLMRDVSHTIVEQRTAQQHDEQAAAEQAAQEGSLPKKKTEVSKRKLEAPATPKKHGKDKEKDKEKEKEKDKEKEEKKEDSGAPPPVAPRPAARKPPPNIGIIRTGGPPPGLVGKLGARRAAEPHEEEPEEETPPPTQKRMKPPPVKPAATREITYKVSKGESVLGVAAESKKTEGPALEHVTKTRAKGPAGKRPRRPPTKTHQFQATDPTAELQPSLL